jgi:hypothetical protein
MRKNFVFKKKSWIKKKKLKIYLSLKKHRSVCASNSSKFSEFEKNSISSKYAE